MKPLKQVLAWGALGLVANDKSILNPLASWGLHDTGPDEEIEIIHVDVIVLKIPVADLNTCMRAAPCK